MKTFYIKERDQKELRISQLEQDLKKHITGSSKLDEKLSVVSVELSSSNNRTKELQARILELETQFNDSTEQFNKTKQELDEQVVLVTELKREMKEMAKKHQDELVSKDEELTSLSGNTTRIDAKRDHEISNLKAKKLKMQKQLDKYYFKCIPAWKAACAERDQRINGLKKRALELQKAKRDHEISNL